MSGALKVEICFSCHRWNFLNRMLSVVAMKFIHTIHRIIGSILYEEFLIYLGFKLIRDLICWPLILTYLTFHLEESVQVTVLELTTCCVFRTVILL